MYKWVVIYLDKLLIITDNQFGFRSKHSTSHALILMTEKIRKSIDQGLFTCGIFLDLCKAFDTVDHSILLDKLSNYGIRGKVHDWFSSYLSNRRQFVSIGSSNSDPLPVRCGVPQGSVLGPLLFLIYVNDFQKCSDLQEFHLFADDTNLFSNNANIHDLESNINSELEKVNTWLCANKLSLNLEKTSFVIFHLPQKHIHYKVRLQISNKLLKQDSHIKYLGIIFDSHRNWKKHIHELGKRISKSIIILPKIRHFVSIDILIQLYYCFVYSRITYGILVWGNTYETSLKSLTALQNKAIRIITFSKRDEHSNPLYAKLKLLKIKDLVHFHNALFMFHYYHNQLPNAYVNFFQSVSSVHQYRTRLASKASYYTPPIRTNYGKFSIKIMGSTVWNQIDEKLKNRSLKSFKQKMKESLLETYSKHWMCLLCNTCYLKHCCFPFSSVFPFSSFFLFFFVNLTYSLLKLLPATVI